MQLSPKMRILKVLLLASLSAGMGGCHLLHSDNNPTAPTAPPQAGSTIVYSVVGASDVIGVGSSRPCLLYDDCDGTGYAWVAARQLRSAGFAVSVKSLGIPAAVISRPFQDLAVASGRTDSIFNFIDSEMPFVATDSAVVTIFAGANDVNVITGAIGAGLAGSDPAGFIDQKVAGFGADYRTLLAGIRNRAKSTRVVVINLPNMGAMPFLASASLAQKQAAQRASVGMTTTVINGLANVRVVDLMCDPRFYQASTYSTDGFHPSDAGYGYVGSAIANAVTAATYPAPPSSCSQMYLY